MAGFKRIIQLPVYSGKRYLLRDEFNDTRAAGAVNGTPATPGPGNRIVTDPEGKITVGGGRFDVAQPIAPAHNKTYAVWDVPIARVLGRMLFAKITRTLNGSYLVFSNTNGVLALGGDTSLGHYFMESAIRSGGDGGTNVIIATLAGANDCFAIVLRTKGCFFFTKAPLTFWKLGFMNAVDQDPTLYAATYNYNFAFNIDFVRIPQTLWYPTPLVSDAFTRADGALGITDGLGHVEADGKGGGKAWTDRAGTMAISTNKAMCTALAGGLGISTAASGSADAIADVALARGTGTAGLALRYQDADNYLYCVHNGTNLQLVKRAAGVETTLIDAAATYGAGRIMRVVLDGTGASAFYNNVKIGTTQVVPASTYANHGLYFTDVDSSLDSFIAWARGSGGEYALLDKYIK